MNIIQTINGIDLLIAILCGMIGIFTGITYERAEQAYKVRRLHKFMNGQTIEAQMAEDGWEFPAEPKAKKKTAKRK